MPGLDLDRPFKSLNIAVVTVSDSRTADNDTSGDYLAQAVMDAGHHLAQRHLIKDDSAQLAQLFRQLRDDPGITVVVSTGGTGLTGRDVTPEAMKPLIDKEIIGFGELFRYLSYQTIGTSTVQSRAFAAICGTTLFFALPGSTGACRDAWEGILLTQLDSRYRPCNFVELLPRLAER